MKYCVVIPVLNQLHYTQQCVDSLLAHGTSAEQLLIIDNGSSDDTPQWLAANPQIPSIRNSVNLGCGGAWTQGALHNDAEWVILLNNDIVVGHDAMGALIAHAERKGLDVISPALIEGELDYDLNAKTAEFVAKMNDVSRDDFFHGVCFAVRRKVFHQIGFLDTDRLLFGREDTEFLFRCRRNGVPVAMSGAAVMHHFGSITQSAMKKEQGIAKFGDHRYLYAKLGMSWLGRQRNKQARKAAERRWRSTELAAYGMTLHMDRRSGAWIYR